MENSGTITVTCPVCGKSVEVQSDQVGGQVPCSDAACGTTIDIPDPAQTGFVVDPRVMFGVGFVFLMIAAYLTIKQLELGKGAFVVIGLLALMASTEFLKGFAKGGAVILFALTGLSTPICYYYITKKTNDRDLAFYIATGAFFALSAYLIVRTRRTWKQFNLRNAAKRALNLESGAVWFALVASSLAFLWSSYYEFLTPWEGGDQVQPGVPVWRRLVLTLLVMVVGVICSVFGRKSPLPFLGIMGLTYIAAGVAKALFYDYKHLTGPMQIGVFLGGGAVLLLGGFLLKKAPVKKV